MVIFELRGSLVPTLQGTFLLLPFFLFGKSNVPKPVSRPYIKILLIGIPTKGLGTELVLW